MNNLPEEEQPVKISCFFSGHRNISHTETEHIRQMVREKVKILTKKGITNFISGGAYGFDTLCAEEVIRLKKEYPHIKLYLFLPCLNHTAKWNYEDKARFDAIYKKADNIILITRRSYTPKCMELRNRAMVDSAMYGIVYCKRGISGTGQTVNMAQKKGRIIVNIYDEEVDRE